MSLVNLSAALYSLRQNDLSRVKEILLLNNNAGDEDGVQALIDELQFPVPVRTLTYVHDDANRTHAWSTNEVCKHVRTAWIFFTRSDYILDFDIVSKFSEVLDAHDSDWNGFVTGHVYHLNLDIGAVNAFSWRVDGAKLLSRLPGVENDYTYIDAGVWLSCRKSFDKVSGLDETLTAWGHAQTHFQWKLHQQGVDFVTLTEPLYYHPAHGGQRDLAVAHEQLKALGCDLQVIWDRYHGRNPYR